VDDLPSADEMAGAIQVAGVFRLHGCGGDVGTVEMAGDLVEMEGLGTTTALPTVDTASAQRRGLRILYRVVARRLG
jgi:hypothetical protein